ncbi:hypothetical protein GIB67_027940 [Kingdonia uniflora]|uniref:Uncharacterized protein n=1 Tax=Kingdonia uniflora TaxID=39325 RepID=A0A7J7LGP7_9MAGN|nr:hypothetical protein GIB67_027940 [Kingdonia uniflora]
MSGKSCSTREFAKDDSRETLLSGQSSISRNRSVKDIPKGFVAVYVGQNMRRFVIPASYLSLPDFRVLMEKAAEEFGFEQEGGLRLPCEEDDFEEILVRCFGQQRMRKANSGRR